MPYPENRQEGSGSKTPGQHGQLTRPSMARIHLRKQTHQTGAELWIFTRCQLCSVSKQPSLLRSAHPLGRDGDKSFPARPAQSSPHAAPGSGQEQTLRCAVPRFGALRGGPQPASGDEPPFSSDSLLKINISSSKCCQNCLLRLRHDAFPHPLWKGWTPSKGERTEGHRNGESGLAHTTQEVSMF